MNRAELIQRQQELLNTAKAAQRELTAEEQAEFDEIQRQLDSSAEDGAGSAGATGDTGAEGQQRQHEDPVATRGTTVAAERQRCADIMDLCREFSVSAEQTQSYINNGVSVDGVRAAILDGMRKSGAPLSTAGHAEVTADEQDKFRTAAGDALLLRAGIELDKPAEGARDLMHMSLRDLAVESMASRA